MTRLENLIDIKIICGIYLIFFESFSNNSKNINNVHFLEGKKEIKSRSSL